MKFQENPNLLNSLIKAQSNIRGHQLRNKFRALNPNSVSIPIQNISTNYSPVQNNLISQSEIQALFEKYSPLSDSIPVSLKNTVEYENHAVYYGE